MGGQGVDHENNIYTFWYVSFFHIWIGFRFSLDIARLLILYYMVVPTAKKGIWGFLRWETSLFGSRNEEIQL